MAGPGAPRPPWSHPLRQQQRGVGDPDHRTHPRLAGGGGHRSPVVDRSRPRGGPTARRRSRHHPLPRQHGAGRRRRHRPQRGGGTGHGPRTACLGDHSRLRPGVRPGHPSGQPPRSVSAPLATIRHGWASWRRRWCVGSRRRGWRRRPSTFPGKGDAVVDPHYELPVLDHDRERLEEVELVPFRAAVDAGARW